MKLITTVNIDTVTSRVSVGSNRNQSGNMKTHYQVPITVDGAPSRGLSKNEMNETGGLPILSSVLYTD